MVREDGITERVERSVSELDGEGRFTPAVTRGRLDMYHGFSCTRYQHLLGRLVSVPPQLSAYEMLC